MAKVITLSNGITEVLFSIRDLEKLVEPEVYEAITYFVENGDGNELDKLKEDHKSLTQEFHSYESTNESLTSCMQEIASVAEQLIEELEEAKRMDKAKIIKTLKHFITQIYNET